MITIVGYGYVGNAVNESFKFIYNTHVVDPKYNNNKISDVQAEGVIVCVGTPEAANGSCDSSDIINVFEQIPENTPVLIKSTIGLENFMELSALFPNHKITLSPEFLRAATAVEDFKNQEYIILGGGNTQYWADIFTKVFPDIEVLKCNHKEAILIKYAENSFLSIKVGFFNHLYEMSKKLDVDFEIVRKLLTRDERINPDHSNVPGPDGLLGWGGHCLPKDTNAMLKIADYLEYDFDILEAAIKYNKRIRHENR